MSDLNELASMVEAATGPDRELDAAIFQALNPSFLPVDKGRRFYDPEAVSRLTAEKYITRGTYCTPAYTASLDAAMTLVPEGWDHLEVYQPDHQNLGWTVHILAAAQGPRNTYGTGFAPTYAAALTAAALRSRAAMEINP